MVSLLNSDDVLFKGLVGDSDDVLFKGLVGDSDVFGFKDSLLLLVSKTLKALDLERHMGHLLSDLISKVKLHILQTQ